MTFLEPIRLLIGAVTVALVGVGYLLLRNRDTNHATVMFANQELYETAVPQSLGWVRYLRAAMAGLVGVTLVIAIGNPALLERVPKEEAYIELALDTSDSMLQDDIEPNRLAGALLGAQHFLEVAPEEGNINVGVVTYNSQANELIAPNTDYERISTLLGTVQVGAGTAIGDALLRANDELRPFVEGTPPEELVPAAIVLLSDGESTTGNAVSTALAELRETRIPVHAIGYAVSDEQASQEQLQEIAAATGGVYLKADSPEELTVVFEQLAYTSAYETTIHSIAYQVAVVAGIVFLLYLALAALLRPRTERENDGHRTGEGLGEKGLARNRQGHHQPVGGEARPAGLRSV